jgi:hypothetical protein
VPIFYDYDVPFYSRLWIKDCVESRYCVEKKELMMNEYDEKIQQWKQESSQGEYARFDIF